ncbi:E3 ubiquitin-protein ligase TRIM21-like [Brachyistius frenatus]|uniref:E3 ubiquitin-protein ligase TRIM21-like n=1 Tax=Brachyistius frenatus TaxID=100188 RepID=UPI0037E8B179
MATAGSLLCEDQFLCSICLEVFTDPVTIPCGHNFCKTCITDAWNVDVPRRCPLCKGEFYTRPQLHVNTFISEMAAKFKEMSEGSVKEEVRPERPRGGARVVSCDVCTENKAEAAKSCLVCLTSYCEAHLEPHRRLAGLKRHKLIEPAANLEVRVCAKHDRPLEHFCRTDRAYVCQFCTETDHKEHRVVPLREEYDGRKAELGTEEGRVRRMIAARRAKTEELKLSVKRSKDDADRETAAGVEVFTALVRSAERSLVQLLLAVEEKQRATKKQAEAFIEELEEEISALLKTRSELEQLLRTEDHLDLLQRSPSRTPAPPAKDWTQVRVPASYEETVRRTMTRLQEALTEDVKKLCADVDLKRAQRYAVEVTLHPETAHPKLVLSDDGKQVSFCKKGQNLSENPERYTYYPNVLGKQSFSSGKSYFAVSVHGKTAWDLGVARESVKRKGKNPLCPRNGYWTVWLRNGKDYDANTSPPVRLSLMSKPQKIGVFVDYDEGVVSFYDADGASLIYSFTGCNFTEKLLPFFSPCHEDGGGNSAPMIICPVRHDP